MTLEHIATDTQACIASVQCKLHSTADPKFILIQPSARHEEKADGLAREMGMIGQAADCGFAMAAFDTTDWARALMPWSDSAVSRDPQVGLHAKETLRFIEHELLPWLRRRYGDLPCIIGGYSLGGTLRPMGSSRIGRVPRCCRRVAVAVD